MMRLEIIIMYHHISEVTLMATHVIKYQKLSYCQVESQLLLSDWLTDQFLLRKSLLL